VALWPRNPRTTGGRSFEVLAATGAPARKTVVNARSGEDS